MSADPDVDRFGLPDSFADQLVRIDHVGVAVADLDAAITLYTQTFGFTLVLREDNVDQGVSEAMLAGPAGASGAHAPDAPDTSDTTDTAQAAQLQLLAPLAPDSAITRFLDRSGPGLQQLALTVRDVATATQLLRDQGVRVLYPEPRPGTDGSMINFVHPRDAGGVLIELVQPRVGSANSAPPIARPSTKIDAATG